MTDTVIDRDTKKDFLIRSKIVSLLEKYGSLSIKDTADFLKIRISELKYIIEKYAEIDRFSQSGLPMLKLADNYINDKTGRR